MKIITKDKAQAQGLTHYYTGQPCRRGHKSKRLTSTGACSECAKMQKQDWKVIDNDPCAVSDLERERAEWVAEMWRRVSSGRPIHVRGLYYAVVSMAGVQIPRRGGPEPFVNSAEHWDNFSEATIFARWLRLIPWDAIIDLRNSDPIIIEQEPYEWAPRVGTFLAGPSIGEIEEDLVSLEKWADGFNVPRQPYKLIIWGEKASLDEVLRPIAERYGADLWLGTGDISNTHIYQMATKIVEDGRPAVIFTFSDFDPSGYSMPGSLGYKLAAMAELEHVQPFEFRVISASLTQEQVRELGLPSTPIKRSDLRRASWVAAMGSEQTEIDALATLRPEVLTQIAHDAISPFFDATLARRTKKIRDKAVAKIEIEDDDEVDEIAGEVDAILDEIKEARDRLDEAMEEAKEKFETETEVDADPPEPDLDESAFPDAVIDTEEMSFDDIGEAVKTRKRFEE